MIYVPHVGTSVESTRLTHSGYLVADLKEVRQRQH